MPFIFATQTAYLLRLILLLLSVFVVTQSITGQVVADSTPAGERDTLPVRDTPVITRTPPLVPVRTEQAPQVQEDTVMEEQPETVVVDSVSRRPWRYAPAKSENGPSAFQQVLNAHPYFGFAARPVVVHTGLKQFAGKETRFYVLIGILLFFALLKEVFPKYLSDLFRLLFRTTLKQKQIREQLIQSPLPSFLLNVLFVISGGLYIDILLNHFNNTPVDSFWLLYLYCMIGLAVIYIGKFAGIKACGWLFNVKEAAETYIFIVFLINKVIGIFLLPFVFLLSFVQGNLYTVIMVLSWCGVGVLLFYRMLFTYASIRNQVKFNPFHFLLYIGAFEVAPLLLIYKALLFFFQ